MTTPPLASLVRTDGIEGVLVGTSGPFGYVLAYRELLGQPTSVYTVLLSRLQIKDSQNQFTV